MKLSLKVFTVKEIIEEDENVAILSLCECEIKAIAYRHFVKNLVPGQKVLVNTTAVDMNLGTGGYHFVIANLSEPEVSYDSSGHIMKLKYTPLQFAVPVVEELEEYQKREVFYIDGKTIVTMLHSQIAPIAILLKKFLPGSSVVVLHNDFCALPSVFSNLLKALKREKLVDHVITFGNSFGGDKEAINVYSALVYASKVMAADFIIVSQGPGMPGTSSRLGNGATSAVEALNASYSLGGEPVLVLRMSSSDDRKRHLGLSHHVETVLRLTLSSAKVFLPTSEDFDARTNMLLKEAREKLDSFEKAHIYEADVSGFMDVLRKYSSFLKTMGRGLDEDPLFFAAASAPAYAMKVIYGG